MLSGVSSASRGAPAWTVPSNGIFTATKLGSKHLYGDSKLVLDYWSKGRVSKDKRADDPDLASLASLTKKARARFEKDGGTLGRISGGLNPADLGYHRD